MGGDGLSVMMDSYPWDYYKKIKLYTKTKKVYKTELKEVYNE